MTATQTILASDLTLSGVYELLGLRFEGFAEFEDYLELAPLSESELQELSDLRALFFTYLAEGNLNEGEVKFLFLSPLLKLAGFFSGEVQIALEENIAEINIEDEDNQGVVIRGRMDLLVLSRGRVIPFWILIVETKQGRGYSSS